MTEQQSIEVEEIFALIALPIPATCFLRCLLEKARGLHKVSALKRFGKHVIQAFQAIDLLRDRDRTGLLLEPFPHDPKVAGPLPVARRLRSEDVLAALADLFVSRGPPAHIRSDNGPEFIANAVRAWLARIGVKTLYITPSSPWENGYCESFNGSMRDELLNGEIFYTLAEAKILIEAWRRHYNTIRPHSSLGYRPPAPEAASQPWPSSGSATLHLWTAMAAEATMH